MTEEHTETENTDEKNEKILAQSQPLMKYARLFALIWTVCVLLPAMTFVVMNAKNVQRYAVVKTISVADVFLADQYQTFADKALSRVDIEKYTKKITVPEIKLDKVNDVAEKTQKTAKLLSKLGVKEADKVSDTTEKLQKQVDKINKQLTETVDKIKKQLNSDVRAGLKKEIDSFAQGQIQKQLALSDGSYNALKKGYFGLCGKTAGQTAGIYNELSTNKDGIFFKPLKHVNKWAWAVRLALEFLALLLLALPPFVVMKLAKKFSATFTQCPYCKKVFISKDNAANILKIVKFW